MNPETINIKGENILLTTHVGSRGVQCDFSDVEIGQIFEKKSGGIIGLKTSQHTAFIFNRQRNRRLKPFLPVTLIAQVEFKYTESE
jgi:hypothetical protein